MLLMSYGQTFLDLLIFSMDIDCLTANLIVIFTDYNLNPYPELRLIDFGRYAFKRYKILKR